MKPSESKEMYLEVIYDIYKNNATVRSIDVAKALGYSKPSVSRAINLLKKENLISQERYGSITLTEEGIKIAKDIKNKHVYITEFLKLSLNLSTQIAEKDACRIEHVISSEAMSAIEYYVIKNSPDKKYMGDYYV